MDISGFQNLDQTTFKYNLDYYAEAYHNDQALISDFAFDALIDLYESKFGPYSEVGAQPRGKKTLLPYYLGSLRKIKDDNELNNWIKKYSGPYVIQDKVDGLTLLYVIKDGTYQLYTRGGGTKGLNVSHLIDYLRLPKLNYNIAVRGEVVMFKKTFKKIGIGYSNPRNMVSGLINSKDSFNPAFAAQLHFLAFRIMESEETPEFQMGQLTQIGFEGPWAGIMQTISIEELNKLLEWRKNQASYEMDGLVIYQNKYEEYPEGENPRHVIAYKEIGDTAIVTVTDVIWEASMHRLLKPVITYTPILLSGAMLERASGFNARYIQENGIGPGAVIEITRSGDTIPYIVNVLQKSIPKFPDSAIIGNYTYNGVEIILDQNNDQVMAAKMFHFLDKLDVKGIGPGRVKLLIDNGIGNTAQLLVTSAEFFLRIPGFGNKLAYQLYSDLQNKTKDVPLAKLMAASTIFPNFSEKRAQLILSAIPDILQRINDLNLVSQIQNIKGFQELANDFVGKLPYFIRWLNEHPSISYEIPEVIISPGVQPLKGNVIVFSGFRDRNLENQIISLGGKVSISISKNTSMVVMKDIRDVKGKAEKAISLGIPLISRIDFESKYLS